jgi:hypothetical protein
VPARQGGAEGGDGEAVMTPHDLREYAALWREQADPKERAELRAMAKKIGRRARLRWLIDFAAGFVALGGVSVFVWTRPGPLQLKLSLALLAAAVLTWTSWRRHQITRASLAITASDPHSFFKTAIDNLRMEISFLTISFWLSLPAFFIPTWIGVRILGINRADFVQKLLAVNPAKAGIVIAIIGLVYFYSGREIIRLRERLRRLEEMRREYEERDPEDEG